MIEKSISTDVWVEKYQDKYIEKQIKDGTQLELFHFTLNKLDILRIRILVNCGLSIFNKSHTKIIDKIDKEFEDYVEGRLSELLCIKKSKKN